MEKLTYTEFIDNLINNNKNGEQLLYTTIELTNACNFKCKHCYLGSKEKVNYINKEKLFNIMDTLKKLGCVSLILTGGEPLMHPDFKEIYIYAKKRGFLITLFTNASLLNDEIINILSKYKPTMVEISLYGIDNKSYKSLTQKKVDFSKIKDNIKKLVINNIRVRLKTVLLKQTYNKIDEMKKIATELGCDFRWDYYVINSLNDNNNMINSTKVSGKDIISKILKDRPKYDLFKSTLNTSFEKNDKLFKCKVGQNSIYINSNLLLSICVIAREPYYDLKVGALEEGIEKVREYSKMKMSKESKCYNCENINICRYCPSKFKIANNDYSKPIKKYCNIASKMRKIIEEEPTIIVKELNKKEVLKILDEMYRIISTNMEQIIDTGNTKEENYKNWKTAMLNELENPNKKWIAAFQNNQLIGYFLYKVNNDLIALDEIQVIKEHQGDKITFIKLFKYLLKDTKIKNNSKVTAYVNNNNKKSIAIVNKFGFTILEKKERGTKYITSYNKLKEKLEQYVIE